VLGYFYRIIPAESMRVLKTLTRCDCQIVGLAPNEVKLYEEIEVNYALARKIADDYEVENEMDEKALMNRPLGMLSAEHFYEFDIVDGWCPTFNFKCMHCGFHRKNDTTVTQHLDKHPQRPKKSIEFHPHVWDLVCNRTFADIQKYNVHRETKRHRRKPLGRGNGPPAAIALIQMGNAIIRSQDLQQRVYDITIAEIDRKDVSPLAIPNKRGDWHQVYCVLCEGLVNVNMEEAAMSEERKKQTCGKLISHLHQPGMLQKHLIAMTNRLDLPSLDPEQFDDDEEEEEDEIVEGCDYVWICKVCLKDGVRKHSMSKREIADHLKEAHVPPRKKKDDMPVESSESESR
jgi:hypothetical protein